MPKALARIPYTDLLPPPTVIPASATSLPAAVAALVAFFAAPPAASSSASASTVVLTGAGLSVASGLADYRGLQGTYRVNKSYQPIYYSDFLASHQARKRYWARSFLGWPGLCKASPNAAHDAIRHLGQLGLVGSVITQNVDSFHLQAHPELSTLELHGHLRSIICTTCGSHYPRADFQHQLQQLNPLWLPHLQEVAAAAASPPGSKEKGPESNPDGDLHLPRAPYSTFRYPPCPRCLANPPPAPDGRRHEMHVDDDGAWAPPSTAGILKPAVVMFGQSINQQVKTAAEEAIDRSGKLLVLGTSLATYSAWRLAKRAKDRGIPIAMVNLGGARGEDRFFADLKPHHDGRHGVRLDMSVQQLLPALVARLRGGSEPPAAAAASPDETTQRPPLAKQGQ